MKTSAVSDAVSPSQTHVLHTADTQRLFLAHEISLCVYTIQCLPALVFGYTPRNELFVACCSGSWAGFDSDDRWDWEVMQWYHLQCRPCLQRPKRIEPKVPELPFCCQILYVQNVCYA